MEGSVDQCDIQLISGWAWNSAAPGESVEIEILDGDRVLATVPCNRHRPDLEAAGKGDGRCAFRWEVPPELLDDTEHLIRVRFVGTDEDIGPAPRRVKWDASERRLLAEKLQGTMRALPWEISEARLGDGRLTITGWAIPPSDGREGAFWVNGIPFESVDRARRSKRIGGLYWYWPGTAHCAFECSMPMDRAALFASGPAVLQYVDPATGEAFDSGQTVYWPETVFDHGGVPPEKNIRRTSGYADAHLFLQEGYTAYRRLAGLLEEKHGAWPEGRTLDWGSGCGRVLRWLLGANLPGVEAYGADVDAANVAYCRDHLPAAQYEVLPLRPPSSYPSGHFQVIYGLSVFTHLLEDVQFAWLAELARICAAGATVLVTIHGDASYCLAQPDLDWLSRIRETGYDASIRDGILAGEIDDDSYYRATFHTAEYVRERWSEHFEVVDILEGFVCHQQDMVVLRKRS